MIFSSDQDFVAPVAYGSGGPALAAYPRINAKDANKKDLVIE